MNIPLTWLKQYVDIPKDLRAFTEKMSMIGHMLDKTTETDTDTVIDLELRGNRADCYSILGIAREAHACYGGRFDIPVPRYVLPQSQKTYTDITIDVKSPVIKRFYSCVISNIHITESPQWMQQYLKDYGMEPINNIVDVTNYVMIETGMPLHAFDKKKIGKSLMLRNAKKGETCETFDGGTISLSTEDVIFANGNNEVLGLVGIVGSKNSGIKSDTHTILLECAGYERSTIRKTMTRHSIQTEAGLRHSHDLHESLCDYALHRAASLLQEISEQQKPIVKEVHNYYPDPDKPHTISYNPNELERLSGLTISIDDQVGILERLDITVKKKKQGNVIILDVTPPLFRTDVRIQEDIVEEVLRIWGYEHIPSQRLSSPVPDPIRIPEVIFEEQSRDVLSALGMNEIVAIPFVQKNAMVESNDPLVHQAIALLNPPTSNHSHMRPHMVYGQLEIVSKLILRGDPVVSLFEIGKTYIKESSAKEFPYKEYRHIVGAHTSQDRSYDYFSLKGITDELFDHLFIKNVTYTKIDTFPYAVAASVMHGTRQLGTIGIIDPRISHELYKIQFPVALFDIFVDECVKTDKHNPDYLPYSQYPPITMDLSLDISLTQESGMIMAWMKQYHPYIRTIEISDVYEKKGARSILFSIHYQSKERNLESEEVQDIHKRMAKELMKLFRVTVRGL